VCGTQHFQGKRIGKKKGGKAGKSHGSKNPRKPEVLKRGLKIALNKRALRQKGGIKTSRDKKKGSTRTARSPERGKVRGIRGRDGRVYRKCVPL